MHEGNVAINMVVQIPALSGDSDEYLIDLQMGDRRNPVHTQKNVWGVERTLHNRNRAKWMEGCGMKKTEKASDIAEDDLATEGEDFKKDQHLRDESAK